MKIISWNCNGALRNKFERISDFDADIYIIQECENPTETNNNAYKNWAKNHLWIGDTKNKGLGIFASDNITLKKLDWSNQYQDHRVKYFLPCSVNSNFDLLGVWTHKNNSPNFGYMGQFWKYLQVNKENFCNLIIAGDFNSNTIWDEWDRWWNHSDVIRELAEIGIKSIYHDFLNEEQGKEKQPTFFHHKKVEKAYHIDYLFASENYIKRVEEIRLGKVGKWLEISDHLPLICNLKIINNS